jgi:hypothetical protein
VPRDPLAIHPGHIPRRKSRNDPLHRVRFAPAVPQDLTSGTHARPRVLLRRGGLATMGAMRIDYKPNGTSGFHCELTDEVGLVVTVDWSDGEAKANMTPDGLPAQALIASVERYGSHEYQRRRTRDAQKRKYEEKEAAKWLNVAKDVAELLGNLTETTEHGWCSDCMTESDHRLAGSRTRLRVRRYVCIACGSPTGRCDVPRCRNFADRGGGPSERARFCAEHGHQIPSFEKLSEPVGSLDEYRPWLEFVRFNAKKASTIAAMSVVGVAVVGPLAFVAAPAIGGAIGASAGLSGAAATSHGLAVLGGGSLAAGGYGMVAGTAVVTAAGGRNDLQVPAAVMGRSQRLPFQCRCDHGPIIANRRGLGRPSDRRSRGARMHMWVERRPN